MSSAQAEARTVTVRFHRSLYDPAAVRAAAARFTRFGTPAVDERDADVLVSFTDVPAALAERLGDELGNHALFETIVARRR